MSPSGTFARCQAAARHVRVQCYIPRAEAGAGPGKDDPEQTLATTALSEQFHVYAAFWAVAPPYDISESSNVTSACAGCHCASGLSAASICRSPILTTRANQAPHNSAGNAS